MSVVRGIAIGVVAVALLWVMVACQTASATTPNTPTPAQSTTVVWGRVPYCNCLANSATDNVAAALKEAQLTVDVKELSPRDGWLYFAVTFDPHSASLDQISSAMKSGGAEVLEDPP